LHLEPWFLPSPYSYFVVVLVVVVVDDDAFVVNARFASEGVKEEAFKLGNFDSCREYYRYWTGYYGLPVAGWNAGNDGKNYHNHKA